MTTFTCPRSEELPGRPDFQAAWRSDQTCSYCGSMNPEDFMARLEAGTIEIGTTDKDYKVYTTALPGTPKVPIKFYFQHLRQDQRMRFFELFQEGRLKFQGGFGFRVLPFFICRKES